jgi:putative tricarboxylic transport membrane protein
VEQGNRPGPDSGKIGELALALGVVVLGAVVIWETREIRITPMNARIGPRVIPYIVGSGMVVVGIWYVIAVLLGQGSTPGAGEDSEDVDASAPTDWVTIGIIGVSLLAYLFLIERAGFIIASSVLFFGAAFGMGSRRVLRDIATAIALSVAVYLVFTRGLSLRLPEGVVPLELISVAR